MPKLDLNSRLIFLERKPLICEVVHHCNYPRKKFNTTNDK